MGFAIPVFSRIVSVAQDVERRMKKAEVKALMKTVIAKFQERLDKSVETAWIVTACVLHPFLNAKLSSEQKQALPPCWHLVSDFSITPALRKKAAAYLKQIDSLAARELLSYLSRSGAYDENEEEDLWQQALVVPPEVWWQMCANLLRSTHLPKIGKSLCQVPAGTAQQERVFSCMGWQSEKRCNRLLAEKVHKLTTTYYHHLEQNKEEATWWDALEELLKEADEKLAQ